MGNLFKYSLSSFGWQFAIGMYMPFLVFFIKDMPRGSMTTAGILLGGYFVLAALFTYPAGWLSDVVGRKMLIFIGSAGGAYMLYQLSFISRIADLYLIVLLASLFYALNQGAAHPMLYEIAEGERQGTLISSVRLFSTAGMAIGTLSGGYLAELYSIQLLLQAAAAVSFLSAFPILFVGGKK
ncbi:MAG: MFS transporter [archaeon]